MLSRFHKISISLNQASVHWICSNAEPGYLFGTARDATAIGANALVSANKTLVLGTAGTNVGIGTTAPQSTLQIGPGTASTSYGTYLQIPLVNSTNPPPAADCSASFAGRMVTQVNTTANNTFLWLCNGTVWMAK